MLVLQDSAMRGQEATSRVASDGIAKNCEALRCWWHGFKMYQSGFHFCKVHLTVWTPCWIQTYCVTTTGQLKAQCQYRPAGTGRAPDDQPPAPIFL